MTSRPTSPRSSLRTPASTVDRAPTRDDAPRRAKAEAPEADTLSLAVRVAGTRAHRTLVARRPCSAGSVILEARGVRTSRPSRLSLQVGVDEHLDVPPEADDREVARAFPWRFLNHACTPTAWFRGRTLIALRDLAVGEEITFDYETTEWELASPFVCRCATQGCTGRTIRGYGALSAAERARRASHVGEWLLRRAATARADARSGRGRG